MASNGKRIKSAREQIDRLTNYPADEAIDLVRKLSNTKFDETIDVAINLGVDPRHADQMVRGAVVMPHGTGKDIRVVVFARGEKEAEAKEAGADFVGSDDLAQKIQDGWLDFDATIATPDMMGVVGRLGRVLGPRGLMPNPKVGTVTPDVETAVKNAKAGQVRYRTDKNGIIHSPLGNVEFSAEAIKENLEALIADLKKAKPATSKGVYLKKVALSSTMGPGLTVDQSSLNI